MSEEITSLNIPLDDAEYDRLESILGRFRGENAMNLEMVDGFFTALLCSPEMTPPSAYLPEVRGGEEMADEEAFDDIGQVREFMGLILRHWNDVNRRLRDDEVFFPILLEDAEGKVKGNDWARGFLRGMELHRPDWS